MTNLPPNRSVRADALNRYLRSGGFQADPVYLVVDDQVDSRSNMEVKPKMEPKGELIIRYEPDTKMLFFAAKKFKEYCVQFQINYKETLRRLKNDGVYLRSDTKRMSKGMRINTLGVQALFFDTSVNGFMDVEGLLPVEVRDETGGS